MLHLLSKTDEKWQVFAKSETLYYMISS